MQDKREQVPKGASTVDALKIDICRQLGGEYLAIAAVARHWDIMKKKLIDVECEYFFRCFGRKHDHSEVDGLLLEGPDSSELCLAPEAQCHIYDRITNTLYVVPPASYGGAVPELFYLLPPAPPLVAIIPPPCVGAPHGEDDGSEDGVATTNRRLIADKLNNCFTSFNQDMVIADLAQKAYELAGRNANQSVINLKELQDFSTHAVNRKAHVMDVRLHHLMRSHYSPTLMTVSREQMTILQEAMRHTNNDCPKGQNAKQHYAKTKMSLMEFKKLCVLMLPPPIQRDDLPVGRKAPPPPPRRFYFESFPNNALLFVLQEEGAPDELEQPQYVESSALPRLHIANSGLMFALLCGIALCLPVLVYEQEQVVISASSDAAAQDGQRRLIAVVGQYGWMPPLKLLVAIVIARAVARSDVFQARSQSSGMLLMLVMGNMLVFSQHLFALLSTAPHHAYVCAEHLKMAALHLVASSWSSSVVSVEALLIAVLAVTSFAKFVSKRFKVVIACLVTVLVTHVCYLTCYVDDSPAAAVVVPVAPPVGGDITNSSALNDSAMAIPTVATSSPDGSYFDYSAKRSTEGIEVMLNLSKEEFGWDAFGLSFPLAAMNQHIFPPYVCQDPLRFSEYVQYGISEAIDQSNRTEDYSWSLRLAPYAVQQDTIRALVPHQHIQHGLMHTSKNAHPNCFNAAMAATDMDLWEARMFVEANETLNAVFNQLAAVKYLERLNYHLNEGLYPKVNRHDYGPQLMNAWRKQYAQEVRAMTCVCACNNR